MTYPLEDGKRSNESFTDSKEVSYEVQHLYVLNSWKRYNIIPPILERREKLTKLHNHIKDIGTYQHPIIEQTIDEIDKSIQEYYELE